MCREESRAAVADGALTLASAQVLYVMHINLVIYVPNTINIALASYVLRNSAVLNWKFLTSEQSARLNILFSLSAETEKSTMDLHRSSVFENYRKMIIMKCLLKIVTIKYQFHVYMKKCYPKFKSEMLLT
jgi:hypothetical protein